MNRLPDGIPFDGVGVVIGPVGVFGWLGHHDGCDELVGRFETVEVGTAWSADPTYPLQR